VRVNEGFYFSLENLLKLAALNRPALMHHNTKSSFSGGTIFGCLGLLNNICSSG
jgi:hypothetical protein